MSNQISKVEKLKSILNAGSVQEQFKNALNENSGVFVASIIDLYNNDNNLQQCDPGQVVMEALKAAVLKLPINRSLGFAWIIPFNNSIKNPDGTWGKKMVPTFQIGYKGYIQMAMRTGQYRIINADCVFEGEYRSKNKLTGEFDLSGEATSDKIVGYFAHIETINGFAKTLYMTRDKVTSHAKKFSKTFGAKNSIWDSNFDEMAIKTVLRNLLSHYGLLSVEMISAMNTDIESDVQQKVEQDIDLNANKKELPPPPLQTINIGPQPEEKTVIVKEPQLDF